MILCEQCDLVEHVKDILEHIHEDIFYKCPRGQVEVGQNTAFHRCTKLLELADKINEFLDEKAKERKDSDEPGLFRGIKEIKERAATQRAKYIRALESANRQLQMKYFNNISLISRMKPYLRHYINCKAMESEKKEDCDCGIAELLKEIE